MQVPIYVQVDEGVREKLDFLAKAERKNIRVIVMEAIEMYYEYWRMKQIKKEDE